MPPEEAWRAARERPDADSTISGSPDGGPPVIRERDGRDRVIAGMRRDLPAVRGPNQPDLRPRGNECACPITRDRKRRVSTCLRLARQLPVAAAPQVPDDHSLVLRRVASRDHPPAMWIH